MIWHGLCTVRCGRPALRLALTSGPDVFTIMDTMVIGTAAGAPRHRVRFYGLTGIGSAELQWKRSPAALKSSDCECGLAMRSSP
jgi:hypothetical protein